MGVSERKEREKQQRRQQIMQAGEKLILAKGLSNITVDEIARECELSKGTLYLYFESKEDIFLALTIQSIATLIGMMQQNLAQGSTVQQKLQFLGFTYLEFYQKHKNLFKILNDFTLHEAREVIISRRLSELLGLEEQLWSVIIEVLKQGTQQRLFKPEIDPLETAILLWSTSNGILQLMEHLKGHADFKDAILDGAQQAFDKYEFSFTFEKIDYEKLLFKAWDMIFFSLLSDQGNAQSLFPQRTG